MNVSLASLESLPIYYQLLIAETDAESQSKIDIKLKEFVPDRSGKKLIHPQKKDDEFTLIQALAQSLLDLRSVDPDFREKAITRYLSFKFSVQIDLINEWHKIKAISTEQEYFLYFTALSLTDIKNYQQSIETLDSLLSKYDLIDPKISFSKTLFLLDCFNLQILNYILLQNYKKATFELHQLFLIIEKIPSKNKESLVKSIYWMAKHKELLLAIIQGDNSKTSQIIRNFNSNKKDIKDYYTLGIITSLLGIYYFKRHDYDKIEDLLNESSYFFELLGSERLVNEVYMNIMSMKIQQGDFFGVISFYEEHRLIYQSKNDIISSLKLAILLSDIYSILNDNKSAQDTMNWIITHKEYLFRLKEIDYWLLLHSVAVNHRNEELQQIANDKIEVLFLGGSIKEDTITLYNIRKTALMDYAKGDFEKARIKLVHEKSKLIDQGYLGSLIDIDLDYTRVLLKQYEVSRNHFLFLENEKKYSDLLVYIKSTGRVESNIILNQSLIYFYLASKNFEKAFEAIKDNLDLLEGYAKKNKFLMNLLNSTKELFLRVENYKKNIYVLLISEINEIDITGSFDSLDVFIPKNNKFIDELWASYCIKVAILNIAIIQIQRVSQLDSQDFNIGGISGLLKAFQ